MHGRNTYIAGRPTRDSKVVQWRSFQYSPAMVINGSYRMCKILRGWNFIHIWTSKIFHPFSNNPRAEKFIMFLYHIVITLYRSLFSPKNTTISAIQQTQFCVLKIKISCCCFTTLCRHSQSERVSRRWGLLWKCSWKGLQREKNVRSGNRECVRVGNVLDFSWNI